MAAIDREAGVVAAIRTVIISLVALACLSGSAIAGGYALSGVGTRSVGMGGAFRGLADDWSAGYWNPAGLTQLEGWSVSFSNSILFSRISYRPDNPTDGFVSGKELDNGKEIFNIPNFSVYRKFDTAGYGLTAGVIFNIPYGLGASWDLYDPPDGFEPGQPYPEYDHESDLSVLNFQPTVAYSITPTLSVGAGVGIMHGSMMLRKMTLQDVSILSDYDVPVDSRLDGTGFGFVGNLGLYFRPYRTLSVGLNVVSGTTLPLEGDADIDFYIPKDMRDLGYDAVLSSEAEGKAELPVPWRFGAGICYRPREKMRFTIDVEYVGWSSVDEIRVELDGSDPLLYAPLEDEYIVKRWEDTVRISSGASIDVTPDIFLLGGYYHETASMPLGTVDPLITSFGDLNAVTLGGGIRKGRFGFNALYERHYFSTTDVKDFEDLNGDDIYDNLPGVYSGAIHVANLNMNVFF